MKVKSHRIGDAYRTYNLQALKHQSFLRPRWQIMEINLCVLSIIPHCVLFLLLISLVVH